MLQTREISLAWAEWRKSRHIGPLREYEVLLVLLVLKRVTQLLVFAPRDAGGKAGRMRKSELIAAIQKEILRHDFGTFVDNPPSVEQGHGSATFLRPQAWQREAEPFRYHLRPRLQPWAIVCRPNLSGL